MFKRMNKKKIIKQFDQLEDILLMAPPEVRDELERDAYIELLASRDALTDCDGPQRITIQYEYNFNFEAWVVEGKEIKVEQVVEKLKYFDVPDITLNPFLSPIRFCDERRYRKIVNAISKVSQLERRLIKKGGIADKEISDAVPKNLGKVIPLKELNQYVIKRSRKLILFKKPNYYYYEGKLRS